MTYCLERGSGGEGEGEGVVIEDESKGDCDTSKFTEEGYV